MSHPEQAAWETAPPEAALPDEALEAVAELLLDLATAED